MTKESREWWIIIFKGHVLILLAILDLLSKPIRLLLWLLTFGLSSNIFKHLDKFLPVTEVRKDFSPSDPLVRFYYREPYLAIEVNTFWLDNFRIKISKERYMGNHIWQRWAW